MGIKKWRVPLVMAGLVTALAVGFLLFPPNDYAGLFSAGAPWQDAGAQVFLMSEYAAERLPDSEL